MGVESRKRTLATMEFANDGTGTPETGNYIGKLNAEYQKDRPGLRARVSSAHAIRLVSGRCVSQTLGAHPALAEINVAVAREAGLVLCS